MHDCVDAGLLLLLLLRAQNVLLLLSIRSFTVVLRSAVCHFWSYISLVALFPVSVGVTVRDRFLHHNLISHIIIQYTPRYSSYYSDYYSAYYSFRLTKVYNKIIQKEDKSIPTWLNWWISTCTDVIQHTFCITVILFINI